MADFYTILTAIGKAKLANGQVTGVPVQFTQMAVGDGLAGAYYNPIEDQVALKHEVWRGGINQIYQHADNANWIVVEVVIPTEDGPFYVREVGIFDAAGDMIAVGKYPETYKPVPAGGAAKDLNIRMVLEVSNTALVTLKIDPAIILATRAYADSLGPGWKSSHIRRVAASGPVLPTDRILIVDARTGDVELTMLSVTSPSARAVRVKKDIIDQTANYVRLKKSVIGQTVEGANSVEFNNPGENYEYIPDGVSNWEQFN